MWRGSDFRLSVLFLVEDVWLGGFSLSKYKRPPVSPRSDSSSGSGTALNGSSCVKSATISGPSSTASGVRVDVDSSNGRTSFSALLFSVRNCSPRRRFVVSPLSCRLSPGERFSCPLSRSLSWSSCLPSRSLWKRRRFPFRSFPFVVGRRASAAFRRGIAASSAASKASVSVCCSSSSDTSENGSLSGIKRRRGPSGTAPDVPDGTVRTASKLRRSGFTTSFAASPANCRTCRRFVSWRVSERPSVFSVRSLSNCRRPPGSCRNFGGASGMLEWSKRCSACRST